jgi:glycosyltransferase involved in cell wall biosynthesis
MYTTLSIVIPVFNGQETLPELVARLSDVLPSLSASYETILVNDGSQDGSWETIQELASVYPWLHGINMMRNYGQHNATLCGVRAAQGEIIVTMDDDLQHPPEEINKLLSKLGEGYDVVYGLPAKLPHTLWRNWFSLFTKRILASVMGIKTIREIGAFRAFRSRLRKAFENYQAADVILDVLLSWGTIRFASVPVTAEQRTTGKSNYNFYRLFRIAMLILTGYSTAPLRFASMLGFFFTIFGIVVFVYVLGVYFFLGSIPGFPFLASLITLFSGTQLFALGLIGEYLARVFDRSMEQPPYVIGDETNNPHRINQSTATHSPKNAK